MDNKLRELLGENTSLHRKQYDETQRFIRKWEPTGLLKGIKTEYDKGGMALILENQARQLLDEVSKTGGYAGAEEWSGVALPLVRKVFAQIAAKDFVSVQPMSLPSGLVFYLDFKYSTAQPGFTTTSGSGGWDNSVYGVTNTAADATEGLYGAGRFGYSLNETVATGVAVTTASATWADVNFNPALSASVVAGQIWKATTTLTGTGFDTTGVRAFLVSGSGIVSYYPAFTLPVDSSGAASTSYVTFIVSGSNGSMAATAGWGVKYHKQPTSTSRGDFEASADPGYTNAASNDIDIPELSVSLKSTDIVAKTRKLKAVWTPEFAQDLNAYHSVDAENELTGALSEYISMEIDLEILDMLIQGAVSTDYWSAQVGRVKTSTTAPWFDTQDAQQGYSLAYTQNQWFQTLGTKMAKMSNTIHQKTMRGGANFAVLSPTVATILESIPGFAGDIKGDEWGTKSFAMGVQKIGQLNNRWTIYKNPYMREDTMLMGFRGTQFLETGAVYAPYIPLIMTPLVYDPVNFTPRKGVMTRYAKKMIRPEFYGKIFVSHMNFL